VITTCAPVRLWLGGSVPEVQNPEVNKANSDISILAAAAANDHKLDPRQYHPRVRIGDLV